MDHQGLGIADVGQMARQLEAVDEANGILIAAVQGEHQHAAHAPPGEIFLGAFVVGVRGQAGIADLCHLRMLLQPAGQGHGVLRVAFHPQAQGLQSLQQQEAVEGAQGRTPVPQAFHAGTQGEGHIAVIGNAEHLADVAAEAEGIPVHQAVISRAGLAHQWKLAVAPVEGAGIDDHATKAGAMASDPFRGAFHHHIGAMLDRAQQGSAGPEGVVDDQRNASLLGESGEALEVGDVEAGIAHRLDIDPFGLVVDLCGEALHVIAIGEPDVDAQAGKLHLELVVGAPVEKRGGDEVVSCLHAVGDRQELGRLPRRGGHGCHAALQCCHPLLEHVCGGIHQTGVDVPEFLQAKQIGAVLRIIEHIGAGLINRHRSGVGRRIRGLAGMQLEGFEVRGHRAWEGASSLRSSCPVARVCRSRPEMESFRAEKPGFR